MMAESATMGQGALDCDSARTAFNWLVRLATSNSICILLAYSYLSLRAKYSRSKIKINEIYFVFYSLTRIFRFAQGTLAQHKN